YAWFSALDADGVYFVTRMKDNADYGVVERRPVPERGPVQRDEIIFLYKLARDGERDLFLRRIEVWDEAQQRTLVFLTNHRRFAASTVAAIYRQRWQIELFFKALKQNLRIKTFVGTSANALQIQVWTRPDRTAPAQVPATACPLRLEPLQSRRSAAPATVRLSRSVLLDRSAFSTPSPTRSHRRTNPAFLVTQLGQQNGNLNLEPSCEDQKCPIFLQSHTSIPERKKEDQPLVKSQKELDAVRAFQAAKTPDQQIQAIENVLTKFPDTGLKVILLQNAM